MLEALHMTFIKFQRKCRLSIPCQSAIGTTLSLLIKSVICGTQSHKHRLMFSRQKKKNFFSNKLMSSTVLALYFFPCPLWLLLLLCPFPIYIIFSIKNEISNQGHTIRIYRLISALTLQETEFPIIRLRIVRAKAKYTLLSLVLCINLQVF